MARIFMCDFGFGSHNERYSGASTGSSTYDSSIVRPGSTYSWRINLTNQYGYSHFYMSNSYDGAWRFWLYIASYPSSDGQIFETSANGSPINGTITLTTTGTLLLKNSAGTQIGNPSPVIPLATWVSIDFWKHSTGGVLKARLNGKIFAESSGNTVQSAQDAKLGIPSNNTCDLYFAGVAFNSTTGANQNSWVPDEYYCYVYPNGAGDNNSFATQVGGTAGSANNYTRVDETNPNDATDYNESNTLNETDDFTISSLHSLVDTNAKINAVGVSIRDAGVGASANASVVARFKTQASGTVTEGSAITPSNTTWATHQTVASYSRNSLIIHLNPQDNLYLTKSNFTNAQIGYRLSATNTNGTRVSMVYAIIGYTPYDLQNHSPHNMRKFPKSDNGMSVSESIS